MSVSLCVKQRCPLCVFVNSKLLVAICVWLCACERVCAFALLELVTRSARATGNCWTGLGRAV